MKGKYSIKILLPLLDPEMEKSYEKLNIKDGADAMQSYANLANNSDDNKKTKAKANFFNIISIDGIKIYIFLTKLKYVQLYLSNYLVFLQYHEMPQEFQLKQFQFYVTSMHDTTALLHLGEFLNHSSLP